jgi:hypothetical protein
MNLQMAAKRIASLSIRQSIEPTESEKKFLQLENASKYFHQPIPNNSNIRLIPIAKSLSQSLVQQAKHFSYLNSCCYCLAICCERFFDVNKKEFSYNSDLIIKSWKESIAKGNFLSTPTFFSNFCLTYSSSIDLTRSSFLSFYKLLQSLPVSLVGSWFINIKVLPRSLNELLAKISNTYAFANQKLYYLEFSAANKKMIVEYFNLSICIDENLLISDFQDLLDILDNSVVFSNRLLKDTHADIPPFSLSFERGSKGIKRFLEAISMLDLFYLPQNNYKFSKKFDNF